jgi:hypothetical protein
MDTLNTISPTGSNLDQFYLIAAVLVALYEVVIRFIPTVADYTIVGFIYRILDFIVENKAKTSSATAKVADDSDEEEPRVFKIFKRAKRKK